MTQPSQQPKDHRNCPAEPGVSPVSRVRTLASQMRDRCLRLDELSAGFDRSSGDQDPESIVALLAKREPLVAELASFGDELAAILNDPDSARALGHAEHEQIRDRLGELEGVMARIRERDKEARATLQRKRDAMAGQLASVNIQRGAARAYSGSGRPVNPTLQDGMG
jgi:hypothetical protein